MPNALIQVVVIFPELETEMLLVPPDVSIPSTDPPVVFNATPRLTVSEPSIALSAIGASAPPSIVPTPFVELSLPVITKTSAITGAAKARQTKADVPSRKTLHRLWFVETVCNNFIP